MTNSKNFLLNPQLSFIKKGLPGNLFKNGRFVSEYTIQELGFQKVLKWKFKKNPQAEIKKNEKLQIPFICNPDIFSQINNCICWLGHSSFYIRINGIKILIDPVFEDLPFIKRKYPAPYGFNEIGAIDYVLISHGHRDHLDKKTIGRLLKYNPNVEFLTALKIGKMLQKWGAKNIQEAAWYQQYKTNGIEVNFLPAQHWNRRYINDFNTTLWGSFQIKTEKNNIFFAGDTGFNSKLFSEIKSIVDKPDFAMLPIGAYMPAWMMKESHLNPEEAVEACNLLEAKSLIPMHYGTYNLSDEPMNEPLQRLKNYVQNNKLNGELYDLAIGGSFSF